MSTTLLFTPYAPPNLEPKNSVGARWMRLLDELDLASAVKDRRTVIKMHLGGGSGFSTIHPFFARKLVERVRAAGAKSVAVTDEPAAVRTAVERGYTAEVLGCPVAPTLGAGGRYLYTRKLDPPFKTLSEVDLAGEIVDAEAMIDFAHVKGHGACGFGGASKNLSMGCVSHRTKTDLHALEGGFEWNREACTRCKACAENCPNHAISFDEAGAFEVFYHDCKFCQHCVLICPERALKMTGGGYRDFQMGMARTTSAVLSTFEPGAVVFINMLMNITVWCDCWGMTTPSLVPDIGILAGRDIVAVEQATLDLVDRQSLIPGSLPPGWEMGSAGHLFERIHGKDPHAVVEFLADLGHGGRSYELQTVE